MTTVLENTSAQEDMLLAPMPLRPLGNLGWNASLFTIGGVKWDTQRTDAEAVQLLLRAYELGVNTFDTAHAYGGGESERKLGLALEEGGIRSKVWVNTKVIDRTYDGAKRQIETSLQRLRTDYVDLMFVHSLDTEEQRQQIMAPDSVLKAIEEYRAAGHIRHVGVSGHWVKHVMRRILGEYDFEAVLFPVGLFNIAYNYSFLEEVLPFARERGMAVLGMKVFGAGRVKVARSIEPYLRYSLNLPIDTAVIGVDSIAQLEQNLRLVKGDLPPLTQEEIAALLPEAREITQAWDEGEFDFVQHYLEAEKSG
jgi:aryl-alcohol dehydrogenase-like predicted oxidoreductase